MNYLQPGQADLSTDTNIDFFDPKLKPATRRFTIRASFAFAVKSFCCPRGPKRCKRHRSFTDTVRIVIDTHQFTKARRQVNDFHRRGRSCWTDWNNGCQKEKLHNNLLFPVRKMMINCRGQKKKEKKREKYFRCHDSCYVLIPPFCRKSKCHELIIFILRSFCKRTLNFSLFGSVSVDLRCSDKVLDKTLLSVLSI